MLATEVPALVRFSHVQVRRGDRDILEDICAEVPTGGSTVLVGPNGAGKTTLLMCLLGEQSYAGDIFFTGKTRRPRMAYVPQQLALDRSMPLRVDEFLALNRQKRPLWLGLAAPIAHEAAHLLALVHAEHLARCRMAHLSGGEQRRVLLACALAREPELLILDEPEAGVDVRGERLFWEVLDAARCKCGFTQIMVSHNLPLVAHYATHVICINKTVRAAGAPRDTLTSHMLMELFGIPIHLYPDQCDPHDPGCPLCGAVGEEAQVVDCAAARKARESARMAQYSDLGKHAHA
ncbi:MAG: metal ABC transporter ATP-binding protein [Desulfovibrio sp.]|nr:metal ABC transporter ATP-binding protein [Desulfovibrio sp.]